VKVVLLSTYDLGRQPFAIASAAAWLREAGHHVTPLDLAVDAPDENLFLHADAVAFHVPMHTATRRALQWLPRVRALNPRARLCAFGLYAPMNARRLRALGAEAVIGGEFEAALADWVRDPSAFGDGRVVVETGRLDFRTPDRAGLPSLERYVTLQLPDGTQRVTGSTEASRGCKHRCRHCPIVPVYDGRFRVVPIDIVLEDVRRQVAAGARHVTFGDPDFWNGIGHAIPLVRRLHAEHPELSYDVTIKIEHLLRHREHLRTLRDTGCAFVTSAVESFDDDVLMKLDKGHTCADVREALRLCDEAGVPVQPTFIAFTPWTTLASYRAFLAELRALGLIERVPPIQLAIRLLIPAGSRLLELDDLRRRIGPFDDAMLVHPWASDDPAVDALAQAMLRLVADAAAESQSRAEVFERAELLAGAPRAETRPPAPAAAAFRLAPVPFLTEPWYC
jgi:radical SAM superfamily enzyme YgiQ (UPF0313 family)